MAESPVVTGCSISCPAIFISNGANNARLTDDSCKFANTSLSLSLCLISKSRKYNAAPGKKSRRLVPQNQIKSLPGQTAWCCCPRICPLSRVLSHAGLHRFVGARAQA